MTLSHPPIIFIRHGETDWNRDGLIQGTSDIVLNALGRRQARAIACKLADLIEKPGEVMFNVSPLMRARQTMDVILDGLDLPDDTAITDERLKEISFGKWEGRFWRELVDHSDGHEMERVGYHWCPQGGESYHDVAMRVAEWLTELQTPVVTVAHGVVGRVLRGLSLDLSPGETRHLPISQWRFFRLADGDIEWFETSPTSVRDAWDA